MSATQMKNIILAIVAIGSFLRFVRLDFQFRARSLLFAHKNLNPEVFPECRLGLLRARGGKS